MMYELAPKPKGTGLPPKGMKVKRAPKSLIEFNKIMLPPLCYDEYDPDDPYDPDEKLPLGTYNAVITDVNGYWVYPDDGEGVFLCGSSDAPLQYPQFQMCMDKDPEDGLLYEKPAGVWAIKYELTDSSGNRYPYLAEIRTRSPLIPQSERFLTYLIDNGISKWDELVGCQAIVSIGRKKDSYWRVWICKHQFVYEPEGGDDDATESR